MPTECNPVSMRFARLKGRDVVADFGGGTMTSDAGALLLGATDRAIGLVDRFAGCFSDGRAADRVVHEVATLVGQRVFGIALGYEDLVGHDELRRDPVPGAVLGRLEARRRDCAPLAGGGNRAPRRLGLCPRAADGPVRGQCRRLCLRPGAQRAARGPPAAGPGTSRGALAEKRRARALVHRVPLSNPEDPVAPAPSLPLRRRGSARRSGSRAAPTRASSSPR